MSVRARACRLLLIASVGVTLGACRPDEPEVAGGQPRTPTTPPPVVAQTLAPGVTFEGLVLPSGATQVASDARGTDFRMTDASDDVVSFIAAQLTDPTHTAPARGVARFERATPKNQDPAALQLYILVMPDPRGGTSIRVLRTPVDASPEAAAARIEQFQRDLPTLD